MADPTPGKPSTPQPGAQPAPVESFKQLASQVAAKHGTQPGKPPAKPAPGPLATPGKGGRKPIQEEVANYLQANGLVAVPGQTMGNPGAPPPAPVYVVSPEFVKECAETILKGVAAWRVNSINLRVLALSKDKDLARDLSAAAVPPPGIVETMAGASGELAVKYQALSQWTPEIVILACAAVWFAKDNEVGSRLDKLEADIILARKKEADARGSGPTPNRP